MKKKKSTTCLDCNSNIYQIHDFKKKKKQANSHLIVMSQARIIREKVHITTITGGCSMFSMLFTIDQKVEDYALFLDLVNLESSHNQQPI